MVNHCSAPLKLQFQVIFQARQNLISSWLDIPTISLCLLAKSLFRLVNFLIVRLWLPEFLRCRKVGMRCTAAIWAMEEVAWPWCTGKSPNYRITQDVDSDSVQLVYKWLNSMVYGRYTLWLFHIAIGNCPVIDDLPIKHGDFPWLC